MVLFSVDRHCFLKTKSLFLVRLRSLSFDIANKILFDVEFSHKNINDSVFGQTVFLLPLLSYWFLAERFSAHRHMWTSNQEYLALESKAIYYYVLFLFLFIIGHIKEGFYHLCVNEWTGFRTLTRDIVIRSCVCVINPHKLTSFFKWCHKHQRTVAVSDTARWLLKHWAWR